MNYLTFGDQPSGVYAGQVVDVCRFLSEHFGIRVRLIAFISMRGFWKNRREIKSAYSRAWVIPSFPGLRFWRWNVVTLCILSIFLRKKGILARGVLATSLAMKARKWGFLKNVAYDGRGAWQAELQEFEVTNLGRLKEEAFELEKKAVLETDFRLGVSEALVRYWREKFGYEGEAHIVVPCTLNSDFPALAGEDEIRALRGARGYASSDVVLVYSGSSAGWQALDKLEGVLLALMRRQENVKVLWLAKAELKNLKVYQEFPYRVSQEWLAPERVHALLAAADYGLLIRKRSLTNEVASPTKFAEYLCCGLPVLISEGIGDFSAFVVENDCGWLVKGEWPDHSEIRLEPVSFARKQEMAALGRANFEKVVFVDAYGRVVREFSEGI